MRSTAVRYWDTPRSKLSVSSTASRPIFSDKNCLRFPLAGHGPAQTKSRRPWSTQVSDGSTAQRLNGSHIQVLTSRRSLVFQVTHVVFLRRSVYLTLVGGHLLILQHKFNHDGLVEFAKLVKPARRDHAPCLCRFHLQKAQAVAPLPLRCLQLLQRHPVVAHVEMWQRLVLRWPHPRPAWP